MKKLLRKLLSVMLICLLCVDSFASVVSDNDGSAFITKSEFDSLKNNFQAQIDQYNVNVDNKIDTAIASYLSGIKIDTVNTLVPEFAGKTVLALNLHKLDKLKFGKMNFKVVGASLNITSHIFDNYWDYNDELSSGGGFVSFERQNSNMGSGFEVFRVDLNNKLYYYDDLRFSWTATRAAVGKTGSGAGKKGTQLKVRWHGWYGGRQTSNGNTHPTETQRGLYYCDLLSDPDFLCYHQTGGIGIVMTEWLSRDNGYAFHHYVSSVNAVDYGKEYILSTDAINDQSSNLFCCFTSDKWTTDLITQQQSLYTYYDTTTYKYDTPADAGLTSTSGQSWTINNWKYFNDGPTASGTKYHKSDYEPTWFQGITWVNTGNYSDDTSTYITADEFYEMIPRLFSKNLNLLKNESAMSNINKTYSDWDGYLYNGLPLYSFDEDGIIKFKLDLTDAEDDLYLAIMSKPFNNTQSVNSLVNTNLDSKIDKWTIDDVENNKVVGTLSKGNEHEITIKISEASSIFYKLVPANTDSKEKSKVVLPSTITFTTSN